MATQKILSQHQTVDDRIIKLPKGRISLALMQWGGEGEESGSYTIVVSLAMRRRRGELGGIACEVSFMKRKLEEGVAK